MPELPEVETIMQGIMPVLQGAKITNVVKRRQDIRVPITATIEKDLMGQKVVAIERRAKYILITFGNRQVLVIHLGMSGTLRLEKTSQVPRYQKHDHFVLETDNGHRILYNDPRRFGMIFTVTDKNLKTHKNFVHLGLEPLAKRTTARVFYERLCARKSPIKLALLDQKIMVGVGNIYASEALYQSAIHPMRRAESLQYEEVKTLFQNIRKTLKRAIKAGGSTLKDFKHLDETSGYFQHHFMVYDKAGEACPDCICDVKKTGGIQKIVQSGRSTFYCPIKQRET